MTQLLNKELRFGLSRVILEFQGPTACRVGEFTFGAWPDAAMISQPDYKLTQTGDKLELWQGDALLRTSDDPAAMGEAMQAKAAYDLADRSSGGMVLHSACLSDGDRALLIPAASSSGKSTLTTWLAAQGLSFLCDDVVFVPQGHKRAVPLIRPVQLKGTSREVLKPWFDWEKHQEKEYCSQTFCLIPPEIIGPPAIWRYPDIKLLLFPKFEKGADLQFERLSASQTVLALMECMVNARNLPGHGFNQAISLAGLVTSYRLRYGDFSQLDPVRKELMNQLGLEP